MLVVKLEETNSSDIYVSRVARRRPLSIVKKGEGGNDEHVNPQRDKRVIKTVKGLSLIVFHSANDK